MLNTFIAVSEGYYITSFYYFPHYIIDTILDIKLSVATVIFWIWQWISIRNLKTMTTL